MWLLFGLFVSLFFPSHLYMHAMWLRSTLSDPMDCSPPGSSVQGILQASVLELIAMPSPGDLPYPGVKLASLALSPALPMDSLLLSH